MPCASNALPPSQSNPISALVMEVMDSSPPEKDKKKVKKLAFKAYLDDKKAKNELVFLDGSFSTELEKENVDFENHIGWTAYANFEFLDKVQAVYESYINIGCDIITTNTYHHAYETLAPIYGCNATNSAFRAAINTAHIARFAHKNEDNVRILLSIGSYAITQRDGSEYTGAYAATVDPQHVRRYYLNQLVFGRPLDYDGVIFETIPTKIDVEMIINAIREQSAIHDVIVSFSLNKLNLRDGTPLQDAVRMLLNVSQIIGVGVNCTNPADGVDQIKSIVDCGWIDAGKHIFIYPNSGEAWVDGQYQGQKCALHNYVKDWHTAGALAVGGCCRVGVPELTKIRNAIYKINGVTEPPVRFRPSPSTIHPEGWFDPWEDSDDNEQEDFDKHEESIVQVMEIEKEVLLLSQLPSPNKVDDTTNLESELEDGELPDMIN